MAFLFAASEDTHSTGHQKWAADIKSDYDSLGWRFVLCRHFDILAFDTPDRREAVRFNRHLKRAHNSRGAYSSLEELDVVS